MKLGEKLDLSTIGNGFPENILPCLLLLTVTFIDSDLEETHKFPRIYREEMHKYSIINLEETHKNGIINRKEMHIRNH